MLNQALYSVNKRAKNYRDKAWEYSFYGGAYYEIAREKKEECYRIKERLLQNLTPTCIHVETQFRYPKVYDYEPEYKNLEIVAIDSLVTKGADYHDSYYNYDTMELKEKRAAVEECTQKYSEELEC